MNYTIATILAVIAILFVLITYITTAPLVPVAVILLGLAIIFGGRGVPRFYFKCLSRRSSRRSGFSCPGSGGLRNSLVLRRGVVVTQASEVAFVLSSDVAERAACQNLAVRLDRNCIAAKSVGARVERIS